MALIDTPRPATVRRGSRTSQSDPHDRAPQLQIPTPPTKAQQATGEFRCGWRTAHRHLTAQSLQSAAEHVATLHRRLHPQFQPVAEHTIATASPTKQLWYAADQHDGFLRNGFQRSGKTLLQPRRFQIQSV